VERVAWIAYMHDVMFRRLWAFLRGVTEEELDWKIHPQANTIRRILAHLVFIEEWTCEAIVAPAAPGARRDPKEYPQRSLAETRALFEEASARTQAGM
jgi:hypothetical protein